MTGRRGQKRFSEVKRSPDGIWVQVLDLPSADAISVEGSLMRVPGDGGWTYFTRLRGAWVKQS